MIQHLHQQIFFLHPLQRYATTDIESQHLALQSFQQTVASLPLVRNPHVLRIVLQLSSFVHWAYFYCFGSTESRQLLSSFLGIVEGDKQTEMLER